MATLRLITCEWWGVGNEPWGDYQMGSMSLPQFELKHNLFAKEMRRSTRPSSSLQEEPCPT